MTLREFKGFFIPLRDSEKKQNFIIQKLGKLDWKI